MDIAIAISSLHQPPGVAKEGKEGLAQDAELAAVGVACQGQSHTGLCPIVYALRMVPQQHRGHALRHIGHSLTVHFPPVLLKTVSAHGIIHPRQPQILARHLARFVFQHIDAGTVKIALDLLHAPEMLMVAKDIVDAIGESRHKAIQQLHCLLIDPFIIKEIPRHRQQICPLALRLPQKLGKVFQIEELPQMHIAELQDAVT